MSRRLRLSWEEAALLAWIVALHGYVATASEYSLLNWFHIDDAFYYFTVARNIVLGRGVTFDGLGPTNGFHPLWMALLVAVYALLGRGGDLILPLRGVVLLTGLVHGLTGLVLYRAGRRVFARGIAWALAVAWVFSPTVVFAYSVGSIESALNALTLAGVWYTSIYLREAPDEARRWLAWGLSLALVLLARLDNIFVAGAVVLAMLFDQRRVWWPWLRQRAWRPFARWFAAWAGPPLALVGGYLLWSWAYVGGIMPVSGQVKAWWGTFGTGTPYGKPSADPWPILFFKANLSPRPGRPWSPLLTPLWRLYHRYEENLLALGLPEVQSWREGLPIVVVGLALAAGGLWLTRRAWWPVVRRAWVLPWLAGAMMHAAYYPIARHLGVRHWYWVGQHLLLFVLAAVLAQVVWESLLARFAPRRWPRWTWPLAAGLLLLVAGVRLSQRLVHRFPHQRPGVHMYLDYARWVEAHTEPGSLIAATGAGSLGYFVQGRTIVNLDGLISNYAYLQAMKQGTRVDYLRNVGLDYALLGKALYNHPPYQDLTPYLEEVAQYYNEAEGWGIVLRRFCADGCE
ncbi:MAG: glycosyltransferase family 39 protein [Chloroflexi bacterium]|nr:glycosyltransferase family 39 protein [Chloroflexota bacterium]